MDTKNARSSYNNEFAETNENTFNRYIAHPTIFPNFNYFHLKNKIYIATY